MIVRERRDLPARQTAVRGLRRFVPAAAFVGLIAPLAPAAVAEEGLRGRSYYLLRLRAAAVQPEILIPGRQTTGVGESEVDLDKNRGRRSLQCRASAAGVQDADLLDGGRLTEGDHHNDPDPVHNPTDVVHSDGRYRPPNDGYSERPAVFYNYNQIGPDLPARGGGPRWRARCADALTGSATAYTSDIVGTRTAGSAVTGRVDPRTAEYVGTARAFVAGLRTPGGTLDLATSLLQVRQRPGERPRFTYRIEANGGTLAAGRDVPDERLAEQFDAAVARRADAVAALGVLGLSLMGPTTGVSDDGGRPILYAPFLELAAEVAHERLRGSRTRLVTIDFEGLYPV